VVFFENFGVVLETLAWC